eukprot:scaffold84891_cov66-Phaeocystis_antarctica.AAC.4
MWRAAGSEAERPSGTTAVRLLMMTADSLISKYGFTFWDLVWNVLYGFTTQTRAHRCRCTESLVSRTYGRRSAFSISQSRLRHVRLRVAAAWGLGAALRDVRDARPRVGPSVWLLDQTAPRVGLPR